MSVMWVILSLCPSEGEPISLTASRDKNRRNQHDRRLKVQSQPTFRSSREQIQSGILRMSFSSGVVELG